jgi:hypothetical protein
LSFNHWLGGYFADGGVDYIDDIGHQNQILLDVENELEAKICHVCLFFDKFGNLGWLKVPPLD